MRYVWRVGTYGYSMKSFIGSISFFYHICGTITWAYFFLIYSARRFPCLYNIIPTKYFWFPKESAPATQRTSAEGEDNFSPFHNSMVLIAEFPIKKNNITTKKLQVKKESFSKIFLWSGYSQHTLFFNFCQFWQEVMQLNI